MPRDMVKYYVAQVMAWKDGIYVNAELIGELDKVKPFIFDMFVAFARQNEDICVLKAANQLLSLDTDQMDEFNHLSLMLYEKDDSGFKVYIAWKDDNES